MYVLYVLYVLYVCQIVNTVLEIMHARTNQRVNNCILSRYICVIYDYWRCLREVGLVRTYIHPLPKYCPDTILLFTVYSVVCLSAML